MKPEESYKILVEWVKYEHERMQHFNNVNMAVHTLIVTAIGILVYNEGWLFLLLVTVIGFCLAMIWLLGICRIRVEADVRFAQLRALEGIMEERVQIIPEQQLFTEGYKFFFGGENAQLQVETLKEFKKKWQFFGFLKLYLSTAGLLLFCYFIILVLLFICWKWKCPFCDVITMEFRSWGPH